MDKVFNAWITLVVIAAVVVSCNPKTQEAEMQQTASVDSLDRTRGIYHWKTTFNLSAEDNEFLKEYNIDHLYVRMFDVGVEDEWDEAGEEEVVPLGTTKFISSVPEDCKVIPTVYITLEALKLYNGHENELAELIVERIYAMVSWNDLGEITEIQYDCDWTKNTRPLFERLCQHTRRLLKDKGAILSGTIRLHQIEEAYYPFDKGVVMIYNTGSIYNPKAKNSIINYDDVNKYLSVKARVNKFLNARSTNCPVMEMAYPTYSWGVVYDSNKKFKRLVSCREEYENNWSEYVRWETSEIDEIMKVKRLVDNTIGCVGCGNIIYHLESNNLTKYSSDEIENLYN